MLAFLFVHEAGQKERAMNHKIFRVRVLVSGVLLVFSLASTVGAKTTEKPPTKRAGNLKVQKFTLEQSRRCFYSGSWRLPRAV